MRHMQMPALHTHATADIDGSNFASAHFDSKWRRLAKQAQKYRQHASRTTRKFPNKDDEENLPVRAGRTL